MLKMKVNRGWIIIYMALGLRRRGCRVLGRGHRFCMLFLKLCIISKPFELPIPIQKYSLLTFSLNISKDDHGPNPHHFAVIVNPLLIQSKNLLNFSALCFPTLNRMILCACISDTICIKMAAVFSNSLDCLFVSLNFDISLSSNKGFVTHVHIRIMCQYPFS